MNPFLEGLVRVLSRFTYILDDNPDAIALAREHNLATLFADLLQINGLDNVQVAHYEISPNSHNISLGCYCYLFLLSKQATSC